MTKNQSQPRCVKQVIVLRKDLQMRKGKMIAQGAHASMKVILDILSPGVLQGSKDETYVVIANQIMPEPVSMWLLGKFAKIAVSVDSESELMNCLSQAKNMNIPCALITDEGRTEFHGVLTNTAIAIGPWWADEIDQITGQLKLL